MAEKLRIFESSVNSAGYGDFVENVLRANSEICMSKEGSEVEIMLHGCVDGFFHQKGCYHILIVSSDVEQWQEDPYTFVIRSEDYDGFRDLLQVLYKQPWRCAEKH